MPPRPSPSFPNGALGHYFGVCAGAQHDVFGPRAPPYIFPEVFVRPPYPPKFSPMGPWTLFGSERWGTSWVSFGHEPHPTLPQRFLLSPTTHTILPQGSIGHYFRVGAGATQEFFGFELRPTFSKEIVLGPTTHSILPHTAALGLADVGHCCMFVAWLHHGALLHGGSLLPTHQLTHIRIHSIYIYIICIGIHICIYIYIYNSI